MVTLPGLGLRSPPREGPAVLLYDIETAPSLVWVWEQWRTNVIATEQDWYLLCFAYKWLGQHPTGFVALPHNPAFTPDSPDDRWVAERLHALFDRADVLVAHNGDKFDQRKANARYLYHGFDPPSPTQTIDTLKEARRYLNLYSASLGEAGRFYGLGEKAPHEGFRLWRGCMAGDEKAWRRMERYNRQDVRLLEELYLKLRPWIGSPGKKAHPNRGHWAEGTVCPKCGHDALIRRGWHRTQVSEYQTLQCKGCGGYSPGRRRTRDGVSAI